MSIVRRTFAILEALDIPEEFQPDCESGNDSYQNFSWPKNNQPFIDWLIEKGYTKEDNILLEWYW